MFKKQLIFDNGETICDFVEEYRGFGIYHDKESNEYDVFYPPNVNGGKIYDTKKSLEDIHSHLDSIASLDFNKMKEILEEFKRHNIELEEDVA